MPSFPYKLHNLVETVSADKELSDIISWLPDGKSFRIHSQEEFGKRVLKDFFPRQKQVKSFMRQLQYYDFENFGEGIFRHQCFRRGQRNLCGQILHQLPTKSQKVCGKSTRPLKQRGRKKKGHSQELSSSPEPAMAPYNMTSFPDDASACSSRSSPSSHPSTMLEGDVSPTCVKEVAYFNKNTGIKGNVQSEKLFNQVLPLFQAHSTPPMLPPQMLTQYDFQAIQAARCNFVSCLQNELMLGSFLLNKRRLSQQEQPQDGQLPARVNPQSLPAWPEASAH